MRFLTLLALLISSLSSVSSISFAQDRELSDVAKHAVSIAREEFSVHRAKVTKLALSDLYFDVQNTDNTGVSIIVFTKDRQNRICELLVSKKDVVSILDPDSYGYVPLAKYKK